MRSRPLATRYPPLEAWRVAPAGFTQVVAAGNIGLLLGSLCVGRRAGDARVANASNLRRPRYRGIFRDAVDGNPRTRAARLVSWVTPASDARQPHLQTPPPRPYPRSTSGPSSHKNTDSTRGTPTFHLRDFVPWRFRTPAAPPHLSGLVPGRRPAQTANPTAFSAGTRLI
jgi:hypothetical protein